MAPDEAEAERVLSELSNELMSPYCPGRTIASCPSGQARKLEDHILAEAQAGKTREEIEASLVERFGPEIIGYAPQPVVLYGAAAAGFMGLLALVWVGRRWRRRAQPEAAAPTAKPAAASTTLSARDRDRLDDALDEVDEF
jgi:cytochrome c-type biogenesis protein CcmH/NrfF